MSKQNSRYEILTPNGFKDFDGIRTIQKEGYFKLSFSDGSILKCSDNHKLKTPDNIFIRADQILEGDSFLSTKGVITLSKSEFIKESITVYDPLDVKDGNVYYSNGLVSHNCEFLGTGDTYIEGSILKEMYDWAEQTSPQSKHKYHRRMWVWKEPEPQYTYMVCIDSSLGRGIDYSAFHIINLNTGEQVAEFYANNIPINEFAEIIVTEAMNYNLAYVVPERNTIGNNLIEWLFDILEYENVFMDPDDNRLGIQISSVKRESILAKMEEYIRTGVYKINSTRTVKELLTFIIDENNKPKADENAHDDLVMSLAVGSWAYSKIIETTPLELSKSPVKERLPVEISKTMPVQTYSGVEEEDMKWLLS